MRRMINRDALAEAGMIAPMGSRCYAFPPGGPEHQAAPVKRPGEACR